MANTRRRTRMTGGRRKRPMDWVVQPETYGLSNYELAAPVVGGIGYEFFEIPLTGHEDYASSVANVGTRVPQLEQTAVRVKGCIHAWLNPATSWWETQNGFASLRLRIRKTSQRSSNTFDPVDPDTGTAALGFGPGFANEDFLWEDWHLWIASSTWGDVDMSSSIAPHKFPVDVRVQRRLRVGEQLILRMDYLTQEAFGVGPGNWPFCGVSVQLRTLVRTIT